MMKLTAEQEKKIEELITAMTLEEKAGQLQQCGPSMVGAFEVGFEELLDMKFDGKISEEEFERLMSTAERDFHEEDLRAGRIGSYNGVGDAETANRLQKIAVEETRLGIPVLFGYDVVHGYRTVMPIPLAESCAWDPKLWEETAQAAAKEAVAAGIHMTFAPMVDVSKDARWGRVSEGAGEDCYLTARFGEAKVRGFQSENLIACVKHFAGYGAVEAGRDYNRVDMSMQRLWEEYLPAYEAAVKAGARAVMPAFNDINGVPCSVNTWLLKEVLREKWKFQGITVSDANAIAECVDHGIAENRREAARLALSAGLDVDMGSNVYRDHAADLTAQGILSEETLNEAVRRILRVKMELGLFEHPYQTTPEREKREILNPKYRKTAQKAAEKSIVLLKNEGILPLSEGTRIGVIGQLANQRDEMLGAWAIAGVGSDCVSLLDALDEKAASYQWVETAEEDRVGKLAKECDVWILTVGETKNESGEAASKADIGLSERDKRTLELLKKYKKPLITILFNGRPLAIPEVAEASAAVLEAWHPGIEAGNALCHILFGEVNPSAKLTMTFPYATGQCPMYYAHINTGRPGGRGKFTSKYLDAPIEPLYPFGFGLSYTSYEYQNMTVQNSGNGILVKVEVTNTGDRDGEEIVQCYVRKPVGKRVRPVKELKAFQKIFLKAKETKQVAMEIAYHELGYYDGDLHYRTESGTYEVFAGSSSVDCQSAEIVLRI